MFLLALLPLFFARADDTVRTQPSYGVGSVKVKDDAGTIAEAPCRAGPNDYLFLEVINHSEWLRQANKSPDDPLVLYLDGQPLLSLHPVFFSEWEQSVPAGSGGNKGMRTNRISSFGVRLEQNKANQEVWKKLARSPGLTFERPMEVSMGSLDGRKMPSWVYPMPEAEKSPFFLVILTKGKLRLGLAVIGAALLAFVMLAWKTGILRDPNLPLRPDGTKPFSLARAQMAFWFFLVIGSYFFLWLLSGDADTLNASTLMLIGISAGTAVSSAVIDASRRRDPYEKVVDQGHPPRRPREIAAALEADLRKVEEEFQSLQETEAASRRKESLLAEAEVRRKEYLTERRKLLEEQISYFRSSPGAAALLDLLGDDGITSFHRFQMCVWTIVLGIIFVTEVWTKMAMPDFNATLLGLMGISAGTFIGFKIPDAGKS